MIHAIITLASLWAIWFVGVATQPASQPASQPSNDAVWSRRDAKMRKIRNVPLERMGIHPIASQPSQTALRATTLPASQPACWPPAEQTVSAEPWRRYDLNFDGVVNNLDLVMVRDCFGQPMDWTQNRCWYADVDCNCVVNTFDLVLVRNHLGAETRPE